jgi:hypothetical protein
VTTPAVGYLDAYGLEVVSDITLPGMGTDAPGRAHLLTLCAAPARELPSLLDAPRYLRNLQAYDGAAFAMLESSEGDVLFAYGRHALFHLSADLTALRYAVSAPEDRAWQRVLLDTVLWTVSLLRGFELLHASAVRTRHGLVALVARTGGGKSSLAAELLRRGATLFADDIVALDESGGEIVAHPGPPLMNLPRTVSPAELGASVLAEFGDERWVALDHGTATTPISSTPATGTAAATSIASPVAAVVLIDRAGGETARCVPVAATSLTLLAHAVTLPHLTDRARRRFDIFGSLSASTRVLSLHADPAVPPAALADLVERGLGAL